MLDVTSSRLIVGAVLSVLVGAGMAVPANAGIKDEYQRAQECDYSKAEYGSDVGVFDEVKVRFCISEDRRFVVYVMRSGKSWALPFDRDYRQAGVMSLNTIEDDKLVHYTKKKGVVDRVILGRKRIERPVLY
ncbi:hypothetical protein [Synechococcus sp. MVIR-18-1]|uniref:hypothetical protein n=1 Tax=Synechococcus sp. MVIR-18-1 TaxID=1386941 RepID=UPI001860BD27|nr:hypothetical protein [Synechococcus sp. MVIR-18-1]QNI77247.1 hypothetical protein SynMVIR181_02286 [Synechococcus sp. MVIR-18-1]